MSQVAGDACRQTDLCNFHIVWSLRIEQRRKFGIPPNSTFWYCWMSLNHVIVLVKKILRILLFVQRKVRHHEDFTTAFHCHGLWHCSEVRPLTTITASSHFLHAFGIFENTLGLWSFSEIIFRVRVELFIVQVLYYWSVNMQWMLGSHVELTQIVWYLRWPSVATVPKTLRRT